MVVTAISISSSSGHHQSRCLRLVSLSFTVTPMGQEKRAHRRHRRQRNHRLKGKGHLHQHQPKGQPRLLPSSLLTKTAEPRLSFVLANLHPHVTMAAIVAKPIIANALVVGTAVAPGREARSPPRNRPSTVYQGWPGSRVPATRSKTTFCRRLRAHLRFHTYSSVSQTPTLPATGKATA